MPALFIGHGNPLNALATNAWTVAWRELGRSLPKPKGILSVSAHWYVEGTMVTAMNRPRTIHDFGGFPPELYQVEYPAPGSPSLARRLRELLPSCDLDDRWGLDHGTWAVLCHLYPDADIPVIQLSIDETLAPAEHVEIARRLSQLRDEGILIFGSGNLVHNLHTYAWGRAGAPFDWAIRFEKTARELIIDGAHESLIDYETLGRDARLSIPTPEHYLPLLYVLGVRASDDTVSFPVEGIDGRSVSMLSVMLS